MKKSFAYTLTSSDKRPITEFAFDLKPQFKLKGLIDSGSNRTWVDSRVADAFAIDLTEGDEQTVGLGGSVYRYRVATVSLRIERYRWSTQVHFVEGWKLDHHILGLRGLFDHFVVLIDPQLETTSLKSRGFPQVETLRSALKR